MKWEESQGVCEHGSPCQLCVCMCARKRAGLNKLCQ